MKQLAIMIAIGALCLHGAQARIGETVKQIEARYGAPVADLHQDPNLKPQTHYQTKEFIITVLYIDGISHMEKFTIRGATGAVLTQREIDQLLTVIHTGEWKPVTRNTEGLNTVDNGELRASYAKVSPDTVTVIGQNDDDTWWSDLFRRDITAAIKGL